MQRNYNFQNYIEASSGIVSLMQKNAIQNSNSGNERDERATKANNNGAPKAKIILNLFKYKLTIINIE